LAQRAEVTTVILELLLGGFDVFLTELIGQFDEQL
jgi:hypothetical protein